jgi:methylmalonyl-CoA mutase C-terminal domain/subunit
MSTFTNSAKVYLGLLGLDQHEAGALSVSRLLSDAGLEVVYGGRFNVPATIAAAAVEEDVDLIGLSCHSWEYLYYIDELVAALHDAGKDVPARTFGPSSNPDEIVSEILRLARESQAARGGS